MGDSSTEIVAPRANEENFAFAFNDFDFSDRVLRIEVIPDKSYHSRKKIKKNDSRRAKVVTLHITSAILAAKSPFFFKLFKNGMRESQHKDDVSLRINASEEVPLMDLLNFMYGNTLNATSVTDLVNLLIVADKFEVTSCMRYSIHMLLKFPMSLEYALLYLELPSSVLMSEIVQSLIDEAKKYVVSHYKDFTKSQEEAMELPLSALEVVLGSEGLQVTSEDDVFDFILKWVRAHYIDLEERREILSKRLTRLICLPNMSNTKLKEVLVCHEFEHERASKLVLEALFSKVELSCGQHVLASKDLATTESSFLGRIYCSRCVVHWPRCVVYFNLKKNELESLPPLEYLDSQTFCLDGKQFFLSAGRGEEYDNFGLFVCKAKETETCILDFEFAVMKKSTKEFKPMLKIKNYTFENDEWGSRNLFQISWSDFMSDNSDYFIDGILHLRAKITLVKNYEA